MRFPFSRSGFTLIEILITTMVLSLAVVFIYEALFISLDGLNYYSTYLRASPWMNEKIWTTQDALGRLGPHVQIPARGQLAIGHRLFEWTVSCPMIDQGLYKIDLYFMWKQGSKTYSIARTAFARYEEQ